MLLDRALFPHAFEYDFIDDIFHVVAARYADGTGAGDPDAQYAASSPFPASDVRGFAVTADGATLVSVPIR